MNTVRVLIIDPDDTPLLDSMSPSQHGPHHQQFRVTQRTALASGLSALQESTFDLVLLNLSLPDASAAEAVRQTQLTAPNIPILALVNEADHRKSGDALSLGMLPYVVKDCQCNSLLRTMQFAMERQRLINERESAERRMIESRAEMTAHLSHELRNALACIHQFGNILIDGLAGKLTAEQGEYVGIILQNASRIRQVVHDLLESESGATDESAAKSEFLLQTGK